MISFYFPLCVDNLQNTINDKNQFYFKSLQKRGQKNKNYKGRYMQNKV